MKHAIRAIALTLTIAALSNFYTLPSYADPIPIPGEDYECAENNARTLYDSNKLSAWGKPCVRAGAITCQVTRGTDLTSIFSIFGFYVASEIVYKRTGQDGNWENRSFWAAFTNEAAFLAFLSAQLAFINCPANTDLSQAISNNAFFNNE